MEIWIKIIAFVTFDDKFKPLVILCRNWLAIFNQSFHCIVFFMGHESVSKVSKMCATFVLTQNNQYHSPGASSPSTYALLYDMDWKYCNFSICTSWAIKYGLARNRCMNIKKPFLGLETKVWNWSHLHFDQFFSVSNYQNLFFLERQKKKEGSMSPCVLLKEIGPWCTFLLREH